VRNSSPVERDSYIEHVRSDGARLVEVARCAPEARIPSCPEWSMRELVGHMSSVHGWVANILETRLQERVHLRQVDELEGDFDAIAGEYESNLARLLAALDATSDDESVWNWRDRRPAPAAFWFRRMAQETVMHRLDAELGANEPTPIDPALAADGIDEFLGLLQRFIGREPVEGLEGSIAFVTSDAPGEWRLNLAPDRLDFVDTEVEASVRGPASDVYRFVLHRNADDANLEMLGDARVIERWQKVAFE
jgi:uncharacterized protein (TIGR03083 family)